jgi:hypothetical protein
MIEGERRVFEQKVHKFPREAMYVGVKLMYDGCG